MTKLLRKSAKKQITEEQEQKLEEALVKIKKQKRPTIYTSVGRGFKTRVKKLAALKGIPVSEYTRRALKRQVDRDMKQFRDDLV